MGKTRAWGFRRAWMALSSTSNSTCGRSQSLPGRVRTIVAMVVVTLLVLAPASRADRILVFTVSTGSISGVRTAEIIADDTVVMRLRSQDGTGLQEKAAAIATRLNNMALGGLRSDQIAVERVQGEWAVTGGGNLIATADAPTVRASGLDAQSLCESWRQRLVEVLRRPYLCVIPHDILVVPYRERRTVRFGGTLQQRLEVRTGDPEIAAGTIDAAADGAVIHGVGTGTTVFELEAGELRHAITIEVKKWAARIAAEATLRMIGSRSLGQMADAAIKNAALSAVEAEPGAIIRMHDREHTPGGYRVSVSASGADYLPVSEGVTVRTMGGLAPLPSSQALLISNYPERVHGVGVLLRQNLHAGRPARLMWHHKNFAGKNVAVAVRLVNAGPETARIRISWAEAGPNPDEIFVGFNAMRRYWDVVRTGTGFQAHVPSGKAFETNAIVLKPADVVSGLMELVVEEGSNTYLEVKARDPREVPRGFIPLSRTGDELAVTPYAFPGYIEGQMAYTVGGRHEHFCVGRQYLTNDEGMTLAGSFGINHRVQVNASNPTDRPARMEVALRAGGGVARFIVAIDGETVQTHLMQAGQEQVLTRRDLGPGASSTMNLEVIPTAGSNLPLTLIARAR